MQNKHENKWSEMSPDKNFRSTPASEQPFRIITVPLKLAVLMSYKVSISLSALTLRAGAHSHRFSVACWKILMVKILHGKK